MYNSKICNWGQVSAGLFSRLSNARCEGKETEALEAFRGCLCTFTSVKSLALTLGEGDLCRQAAEMAHASVERRSQSCVFTCQPGFPCEL